MKLYASNLSYNTGNAELNDLFKPFGEVISANVITDRATGQSRGFGFVEMASVTDGNAAIKGLNSKEVEGRQMSVSVAREKNEGSGYNGFSKSRDSRNNYGR